MNLYRILKILTGYSLFKSIESSENYREIIRVLSSIGLSCFVLSTIYLLFKSDTIEVFGSQFVKLLTTVLLYLTWVGALWVARETFDQKNIANKQIKESRNLLKYELQPYIRLQFKLGSRAELIKIKNEGRGSAVDLKFDLIDIPQGGYLNPIQIMTRPIMSPGGKSSISVYELAKENSGTDKSHNSDHISNWLETCLESNLLEISCTYKDILGNKYKAHFKGDKTYFDGFMITFQKLI